MYWPPSAPTINLAAPIDGRLCIAAVFADIYVQCIYYVFPYSLAVSYDYLHIPACYTAPVNVLLLKKLDRRLPVRELGAADRFAGF